MQQRTLTRLLCFALGAAMSTMSATGADSCSAGGLTGECVSTSACSGAGGKSTPGFCPGAKDIQCCTYGTCKSGAGKCGPKASCGGKTEVGLCPGAADIQCCTDDAPSSPPPSGGGSGSSGSCPPNVNAGTVSLMKEFEGFVKSPDPDPTGNPTVGFGHKCIKSGCAEVPFKFPLTADTANQLLQSDLKKFEICLKDKVTAKLNANQYGALISWSFNVGCGNMESSTLVKRLNKGESPNTVASEELPKWNRASGQVLSGLTRRRKAEVALFKTATGDGALPC